MRALTDFEREVTSKTERKLLEKLLRDFDEQPFSRRSLEPERLLSDGCKLTFQTLATIM
jgi:hypothetical protein